MVLWGVFLKLICHPLSLKNCIWYSGDQQNNDSS